MFLKTFVLFSMLPTCSVIVPYNPHNIIICAITHEFVMCIKNKSIISI